MGVLSDLGHWLWRLLPANPILVRVVTGGGKRTRHAWARGIYLAALFFVILFSGTNFLAPDASLAELAKQTTRTFLYVSLVQLFLMSFIAPVFTAGAITQEKDANTFHILLTTPLTNGQIVLGTLMSRLYFVWVLLLAGLPIFCITMIFGGVTFVEVFMSLALAATTGLVTGALAILISISRVGTRRTIFAFFLGIAVYLAGGLAIGLSPYGQFSGAPAGSALLGFTAGYKMSWLSCIHPFLALFVVTGQTPAPPLPAVAQYGWPVNYFLAYPAVSYLVLTTLAALVMVAISLAFVRKGAKEGETTWWTGLRERFLPRRKDAERRAPRSVWRNPIAWREAATRGSAGGRSLARLAFIVGGTILGIGLAVGYAAGWSDLRNLAPADMRAWLTAITWIELAVILIVVTNTAATTLTREKETLSMELLLTTPLTSRYIIAGMLRGLVSFVLPMIAVPFVTLLAFLLADLLKTRQVMTPEAVLLAPLLMIAYASVAALIGLQFSLISKKTVQAVSVSTAVVLGGAGVLWGCGAALGQTDAMFAAVVYPFTPFPAMQSLVDPAVLISGTPTSGAVAQVRLTRMITALISGGVYALLAFTLYQNMVRSFDMTIRRQSA